VTLRLRVLSATAAAVALGVLATATAAYFIVHHDLFHTIDVTLARRATRYPESQHRDSGKPSQVSVIQIISASGRVVSETPGEPRLPVDSRVRAVAKGRAGRFNTTLTAGSQALRVLTSPLPGGGALQVAAPLATVEDQLHRLLLLLGLASIAGVALAIALGWVVSTAALRPLRHFVATIERAAHRVDLSQRVRITSRDELGRLGREYDGLLDALERSRAAQRRLVQDAAHELRTPLTSLQTNAELMTRAAELPHEERAAVTQAVLGQLNRLNSLINDVVDLAQSDLIEPSPDGNDHNGAEHLRLDDIVAGVIEHTQSHGLAKRVAIEARLQPTEIRADLTRVQRATANLIDNAIKWSPPDTSVEVTCLDGALTVRDHGPGIDPADLPYIFERFYRSASARKHPGSGLGLAIVRQAVAADDGRIDIDLPEGGGTQMRITWPAAPTSPIGDPGRLRAG